MGGYGAVSLLCRYPGTFSASLSHAGALDPAFSIHYHQGSEPLSWMQDILGDYWENPGVYREHNALHLLNRLKGRDDVFVALEVGREDVLIDVNRDARDWLDKPGIPHIYAEYPGGHQWGPERLLSLLPHLQYWRNTRLDR